MSEIRKSIWFKFSFVHVFALGRLIGKLLMMQFSYLKIKNYHNYV